MAEARTLTIFIDAKGGAGVQRELDGIQRKGSAAGGSITKWFAAGGAAGLAMGAFNLVAKATGRLFQGLIDSARAGMDAAETVSLVTTSFGEQADAIRAWSETSTASIVQTRLETSRQAATIFNMTKAMGVAEDSALDMAKSVTELSGDMASFFNLQPAEAFDKLRSAIAGEFEPLKAMGIVINEARLKQEALNLGLYDGKGALDANAKAQAALSLVMRDAGPAVGDLARTQDGAANVTKNWTARLQEAKENLGGMIGTSNAYIGTVKIMTGVLEQVMNFTKEWREENQELAELMDRAFTEGAKVAIKAFVSIVTGGIEATARFQKFIAQATASITGFVSIAAFKVGKFLSWIEDRVNTTAETISVLTLGLVDIGKIEISEEAEKLAWAMGDVSVKADQAAEFFDEIADSTKELREGVNKFIDDFKLVEHETEAIADNIDDAAGNASNLNDEMKKVKKNTEKSKVNATSMGKALGFVTQNLTKANDKSKKFADNMQTAAERTRDIWSNLRSSVDIMDKLLDLMAKRQAISEGTYLDYYAPRGQGAGGAATSVPAARASGGGRSQQRIATPAGGGGGGQGSAQTLELMQQLVRNTTPSDGAMFAAQGVG